MSKNKFYTIYNATNNQVLIVGSLDRANKLRKGNKNVECRGFKTKSSAENWIRIHNYKKVSDETVTDVEENEIILKDLLYDKDTKEKFVYFLSNIDEFLEIKKQLDKMLIIPKEMRNSEYDYPKIGIWKHLLERFDKFCVEYDNYSKTDILSYALLEFLNKYESEEKNIKNNLKELTSINKDKEDIIFFDMGTGRGIGAEVRVTNAKGESLLNKLENSSNLLINEHGNINLGENVSTLYGELYAFYLALLIVNISEEYKAIAGDNISALKCYYEEYNKNNFSHHELDLINAILKLKDKINNKFKLEIFYVSGNINPADLGFHRKK